MITSKKYKEETCDLRNEWSDRDTSSGLFIAGRMRKSLKDVQFWLITSSCFLAQCEPSSCIRVIISCNDVAEKMLQRKGQSNVMFIKCILIL